MSEDKAKAFEENPDRFEDLEKVAMVIKKNEEGKWMVLINPMSEQDAYVVRGLVEDKIREFQAVMQMQKAKQSGIIKPGENGFKQGLRSFLNKR